MRRTVQPQNHQFAGIKTVLARDMKIMNSGSSSETGRASQVALVVKNLPANAEDIRDMGSIPGWGKSPEAGHGHPLQYSCLENHTDRGPTVGYSP